MEEVKVKEVKVRARSSADATKLDPQPDMLTGINQQLKSIDQTTKDTVTMVSIKGAQLQITFRESLDTINKDIRTTFTGIGALTLINTILICALLFRSLTGC